MQGSTEKLINKIEARFQFLIVILFFFFTIFPGTQLQGCVIVVGFIIDYIVFSMLDEKIEQKYLKWINATVLIGIGSYIVPLALMAMSIQNPKISWWEGYAWMGSTYVSILSIVVLPAILLVLLLGFGINWKKLFN